MSAQWVHWAVAHTGSDNYSDNHSDIDSGNN